MHGRRISHANSGSLGQVVSSLVPLAQSSTSAVLQSEELRERFDPSVCANHGERERLDSPTLASPSALQAKEIRNVQSRKCVRTAAAEGLRGPAGELPHLEAIQASFGHHDVRSLQAHVGGEASRASKAIGANAYAIGNKVAFAQQPDLHTVTHEAVHVIQQRKGVQLPGGVGRAGDGYEVEADKVADLVVQGQSVEGLLDRSCEANGHTGSTLQLQETSASSAEPSGSSGTSEVTAEEYLKNKGPFWPSFYQRMKSHLALVLGENEEAWKSINDVEGDLEVIDGVLNDASAPRSLVNELSDMRGQLTKWMAAT